MPPWPNAAWPCITDRRIWPRMWLMSAVISDASVLICLGAVHQLHLLLLHKQRQRRRIAMQKTPLAYRADFAVAEEAGQAERAEALLDHLGVVIRAAEQVLAASVAAAETAAVDGGVPEPALGAREQ